MRHMDDLEKRLHRAGDETRRAARQATPPPIQSGRRSIPSGWLVFAGAFALVVLSIGILPVLTSRTGTGDSTLPSTVAGPSSTLSPASTTVPPVTSTAPAIASDCSAAGMDMPAEQEGLPSPVAEMRRAMASAAIVCDFETLESLAGPDMRTDFTGGRFENIPMWEEDDLYPALALLVGLFDTPYATQEVDGDTWYVWPSAFVYETWDDIPEADLDALLTVYSQEELDQYRQFGSYALWRTAITEDGDWRFFIAGD